MSSPAVDQVSRAVSGTVSSLVVPATASNNNEVAVIFATSEAAPGGSGAPIVSSVAATGLTYTKYGEVDVPNVTGQFANQDMRIEVWVAPIASSGTYSTTVTWAATCDAAYAVSCTVSNIYNILSWFDSNPGLPAKATSLGGDPSVTYSTTQADDLLLFEVCYDNVSGIATDPSGWTRNNGPFGVLGTGNRSIMQALYSKQVSAVQTSQSVSATNGHGSGGLGIVLALTADAKSVPLQTFVVCMCG